MIDKISETDEAPVWRAIKDTMLGAERKLCKQGFLCRGARPVRPDGQLNADFVPANEAAWAVDHRDGASLLAVEPPSPERPPMANLIVKSRDRFGGPIWAARTAEPKQPEARAVFQYAGLHARGFASLGGRVLSPGARFEHAGAFTADEAADLIGLTDAGREILEASRGAPTILAAG